MYMKKNRITKDLKRMGLLPTKKQYGEIKAVGIISLIAFIVLVSFYGMWRYPVTHYPQYDYLDIKHHSGKSYQHYAYQEDLPYCGNDPYYRKLINA